MKNSHDRHNSERTNAQLVVLTQLKCVFVLADLDGRVNDIPRFVRHSVDLLGADLELGDRHGCGRCRRGRMQTRTARTHRTGFLIIAAAGCNLIVGSVFLHFGFGGCAECLKLDGAHFVVRTLALKVKVQDTA